MHKSPRGDLFARILGALVFLAGIGVILGVLWLALEMWRDPNLGLHSLNGKASPSASDVGIDFGKLLVRILLLFLGSVSGSMIANKGVHMYFSALAPKPPMPAPPPETP